MSEKATADNNPKCETCAHWEQTDDKSYGHCHRYPPTLIQNDDRMAFFPVVRSDNWCGEHKEK